MKRTILYTIFLFSIFSCKNYLDIKPYGKTIPKTAEEFSALLNRHLENIDYGEEIIAGNVMTCVDAECFSDNLEASLTAYPQGNYIPLYVGDKLSSKQRLYSGLYSVIKDCNIVIQNLKKDGTRETNDILGLAHVIRGVCYYDLLRDFCEPCNNNLNGLGVPLVLEFDIEAKPLRNTEGEVIEACEKDFQKALEYGIAEKSYRYNDDVIRGYLARLYFWAGNFGKALEFSELVLEKHPLLKDSVYLDMMTSSGGMKGNIIFKSGILENGGKNAEYSGKISSAQGRPLSKKFIDLFKEKDNDVRYRLAIGKKRVFNKKPVACMRSAEFQLIKMESLYHLGKYAESLAALNELRKNRIKNNVPYENGTLPPVNTSDIIKEDCKKSPLTPLIYAILCERRKELFMEGDRWYELKRNGRPEFWVAKQGRKYTTKKFMYTFPLPLEDITILKPNLIQNEGYENVK